MEMDRQPAPEPRNRTTRRGWREPRMLVAATASAILFVVVLASMLQGRGTVTPSQIAGLPSAAATGTLPSGSPVDPTPTTGGSSPPIVVGGPFLVTASARDIGPTIRLAAGPDDGLYVAVPDRGAMLLALLGGDGAVRAGWPVRLPSAWCPTLLAAADGTVRVICNIEGPDDGLNSPMSRLYAFNAAGAALAGWPIEREAASAARMVGTDLAMIVVPYRGDVPEPGVPEVIRVDAAAADGTVRTGAEVSQLSCCMNWSAIGPDGIAYVNATRDWDTAVRTDILAFDADGIRPGWPISIEGNASEPAFDGKSRIHAFAVTANSERRTLVLDATGNLVGGTQDGLPFSTNPWAGAGADAPGPLLVTPDGRSYVVGGEDGTQILALDASSKAVPGWPYRSDSWMEQAGYCSAEETGCGTSRVGPVVGAADTLYVSLAAENSATGSSIVALGPDGRVVDGWPVGLRRPGAMIWALEPGREGVFALAVEPETRGYSATILSIAGDSTVRWTTTIVEP